MNTQFPDVMVDIETTGTQAEHTNMIQLAAVKFNAVTGEVDASNMFNRCLLPLPTRFWEEGTRAFWSQHTKVLDQIYSKMEPPKKVLEDFRDWAHGSPVMWGKPTHFDFVFLQSYFRELEVAMPFHFREAQDMNSFIRGRFFPEPAPRLDKELPFEGDVHNALHDVLHQIKVVFEAIERTK